MDFDHGWKHSAVKSTRIIRKSYSCAPSPYPESLYSIRSGPNSFAPSPYPEPLYNIRSGPSSLVNLPCCNSPGCSNIPTFSPESYTTNIINQNVRYHPYQSPSGPFMDTDYRRHKTRSFYSGNRPNSSTSNDSRFDSNASYQSTKIPQNFYKSKLDDKTNFKSNPKRRKQNKSNNATTISKGGIPTYTIDDNPQVNYDPNIFLNPLPDKKDFVNIRQEKVYSKHPWINDAHYGSGKKYLREEDMKAKNDNTKFSVHNSNDSEKINLVRPATENTIINSGCQNIPVINLDFRENEGTGTDLIFGDTVTSAVVNSFESKNDVDLSNCQATHITMPENSIFNIQDIRQENLENTDLANYFFKSIFEGKDENGGNVVVLVGDSNTQAVDLANITNTSTNNQSLETTDNQATLTYLTENTAPSSQTTFESQVQEMNNEVAESTFFSHMDYSNESETATEKEHCRAKNANTGNENPNKNHLEAVNQTTRGNCTTSNFVSQPSTSRENGIPFTNVVPNVGPSNAKCNCKCKHFRVRQEMPRWRRRLLWKCNESVKNMQRVYFRRFMKKVKHENEHMMVSEDFWNMYGMIVTRVGGSVLQTMYNILPELIRLSRASEQRNSDAASQQSRRNST